MIWCVVLGEVGLYQISDRLLGELHATGNKRGTFLWNISLSLLELRNC